MREIRQSGSEGGARSIPRPYPYRVRKHSVDPGVLEFKARKSPFGELSR
jgi:hypothetical protein